MIAALVLACATVHVTISPPKPLDLERMLEAIKQVEAWDGKTRGKAGEWGPWQMTPEVWHYYTTKSMTWATPFQLRTNARRELVRLSEQIVCLRQPVTAFNLALAYGGGLRLIGRKEVPAAKLDYAQRVENCYQDGLQRPVESP